MQQLLGQAFQQRVKWLGILCANRKSVGQSGILVPGQNGATCAVELADSSLDRGAKLRVGLLGVGGQQSVRKVYLQRVGAKVNGLRELFFRSQPL